MKRVNDKDIILDRKLQVLQELVELKKEKISELDDKYRFYSPIGKMEEFLDNALSGKYLVALMSSANGTGKSTAISNLIWHLTRPCDNPFFQQELMVNWKHKRRIRIVSDTATIKGTLVPMLIEYCPKDLLDSKGEPPAIKNGKDYLSLWTIPAVDGGDDWILDIMTYEQSPKQFESANIGLVLFDEPPPQTIYKASIARLRSGGLCLIFATPLTGSAWMYDKIVANDDREKFSRYYLTAEVEDACIEHGVRGFLTHENIEKMVQQYDPADLQARVFGKFQHLIGLVFKQWNRSIHVIEPFNVSPEDYVVIRLWDSHPRVPEAVLWVAIDRSGRKFVVDELFLAEPLDQLIPKIKKIDEKYRMVGEPSEPAMFNTDNRISTTYSIADLVNSEKYGLKLTKASKQRAHGITLVQNALSYVIEGGEFVKPPMLFVVGAHCPRTVYEFEHWQWDEWRGSGSDEKNPKAKPVDKDDHQMENIGRAFLENTEFTEMETKRKRRVNSEVSFDSDDPY